MILAYSLCVVLSLPIFIHAEDVSPNKHENDINYTYSTKTALDWVSDSVLNIIDSLIPNEQPTDATDVEGRKRKKMKLNKYVLPLLIGFMLIKSILLPIALKALAVLSGKAVVLSLMSLILAAIVGLRSVAQNAQNYHSQYRSDTDVVHLPLSKYRRKDIGDIPDNLNDEDPYKYYRDRRRRK